ncbi:hypothetical protein PR350_26260 [Mycobacterium marinum]|nr:hypothetical protein [Mycobacterium marinum]MDC9008201.1 hypothetical protein [Mycobacterium marinum]
MWWLIFQNGYQIFRAQCFSGERLDEFVNRCFGSGDQPDMSCGVHDRVDWSMFNARFGDNGR